MPVTTAPPAAAPDGYRPIDPFPRLRPGRSFVSDDPAGDRLRVAYFHRDGAADVLARAWFGPGAEGPPGHAHGGSVAAVLDEALGAAAWLAGHPAVVARLTVDMRDLIPLGTDATIVAGVDTVEGRKVTCRARMTAGGRLLAEAEAICVTLTDVQFSALEGR